MYKITVTKETSTSATSALIDRIGKQTNKSQYIWRNESLRKTMNCSTQKSGAKTVKECVAVVIVTKRERLRYWSSGCYFRVSRDETLKSQSWRRWKALNRIELLLVVPAAKICKLLSFGRHELAQATLGNGYWTHKGTKFNIRKEQPRYETGDLITRYWVRIVA